MIRIRALLTGLALLGLLAGCGIPQDAEPRLIASEPDGLSTTTEPTDVGGPREVDVYLLDRSVDPVRLARRERSTTALPGPLEAVTQLLRGATAEDGDRYTSAIPTDTQLLPDSEEFPELIILDLSSDIERIAAEQRTQAYAQLVYTATQYNTDATVRFRTDGEGNPVPTDEDDKREVTRNDYSSLDPEG